MPLRNPLSITSLHLSLNVFLQSPYNLLLRWSWLSELETHRENRGQRIVILPNADFSAN
jgi:hypothetical protein